MSELSGNPEQVIAVFQKFNSRFTVLENDCWQWNAATSKDGYGFMRGCVRHNFARQAVLF